MTRRPPLSARELRQQNLLRRNLRRPEAAAYMAISERQFSQQVKQGRIPPPKVINTGRSEIQVWTIEMLDEVIDRLPSRGNAAGAQVAPVRRLFNL